MRTWTLVATILLGDIHVAAAADTVVRFLLPSFEIVSGRVSLLAADTLTTRPFGSVLLPDGVVQQLSNEPTDVRALEIEKGRITVPLSATLDEFIAVFGDLVLVRKDGSEIRVDGASSARISLDRRRLGDRVDVSLPFVTVLTVRVTGSASKPLSATEIEIVGEDSTTELSTDVGGQVRVLVTPGNYDIRMVGIRGRGVQLKVDPNAPDEIAVQLNR